jgi:hypothetical protein
MYFNISLTVQTGLCSRINKLTTHTCAHYITVLCDKPQSTNHMIRSAHADKLTAINVRKQILTEPFILLFNARPSDDTVLYTAHCDAVLIIQTVNRRTEISWSQLYRFLRNNLYIITGLYSIWYIDTLRCCYKQRNLFEDLQKLRACVCCFRLSWFWKK